MINQTLYERLQSVAGAQTVIYYDEIAPLVGLEMRLPDANVRIGELLAEISIFECQRGRPLLSAVVMLREDNQPGRDFFEMAYRLGKFRGGDPYVFFIFELNRVQDYWHTE